MRKRSWARWVVLGMALATGFGVGVSTIDACERCTYDMCISVAHDGAESCSDRVVLWGSIVVHTCNLTGVCTWGDGGSAGPCQPCVPAQKN